MPVRPRQVTIAGWTIVSASVLIVIAVAQQIQQLGSVAMGDAIERVLEDPVLASVSISVDDVELTLRILGMVAAGCATAMAILGWQVLARRSTSARLALSILAVPLLIGGLGTGGVLSTAAVVAVVFLWTPEARSWFAGTWKPEPPREAAPRQAPPREAPPRRIGQVGGSEQPRPTVTSAPPPPSAAWPPPTYVGPSVPTATPPPPSVPSSMPPPTPGTAVSAPVPHAAGERPAAVLVAVVVTWVFSVLAAATFLAATAVIVSDPSGTIDRIRETYPDLIADQDVTTDSIRAAIVFLAAVVVLWSLSACVLAFLVLRRAGWARIVLMVCAGAAALVLVLATLANPVMVVPLVAATATVGLLARRDVASWLR